MLCYTRLYDIYIILYNITLYYIILYYVILYRTYTHFWQTLMWFGGYKIMAPAPILKKMDRPPCSWASSEAKLLQRFGHHLKRTGTV